MGWIKPYSVIIVGIVLSFMMFASCATVKEEATAPAPLAPRVYVANESSNSVTVIDVNSLNVIATIDSLNHSTHDLSLSRDGKLLLATNLASGRLSVIDTQNLRILGTIPTGKGPTGLTFSRDGALAFVSNQGDKTVAIVETASHRIIKTIPVGNNPHFLVLGPDGRIWGTNTGDDDIFIIDPAAQQKIATFKVGAEPQQIAFGYKGIVGPNAYVTVSSLNKVIVVSTDPKNLRILGQIDVGQRPNGIWSNPDGTRIYVGHETSNDLRVIDTGTSEVIATVPVGRKPIKVVVSK